MRWAFENNVAWAVKIYGVGALMALVGICIYLQEAEDGVGSVGAAHSIRCSSDLPCSPCNNHLNQKEAIKL